MSEHGLLHAAELTGDLQPLIARIAALESQLATATSENELLKLQLESSKHMSQNRYDRGEKWSVRAIQAEKQLAAANAELERLRKGPDFILINDAGMIDAYESQHDGEEAERRSFAAGRVVISWTWHPTKEQPPESKP